jgi:precorrin-2 dehydrogenase / sirohydrochlorin ferrochelatase
VSGVPVLLEASALRVLVVGGGAVAGRKAGLFAAAGAEVRVVSPASGEVIRALAESGRVTLLARRFEAGDIGDADLVVAATDDRATNAQVARAARAAHRLVNVADAAEEGSFSTMATHRAGNVVVGVSTGVPAAAARMRDAIAERFDERYALALDELSAMRDALLASGQGARWRALSADVLGTGFCESVDADTFHRRMAPWR